MCQQAWQLSQWIYIRLNMCFGSRTTGSSDLLQRPESVCNFHAVNFFLLVLIRWLNLRQRRRKKNKRVQKQKKKKMHFNTFTFFVWQPFSVAVFAAWWPLPVSSPRRMSSLSYKRLCIIAQLSARLTCKLLRSVTFSHPVHDTAAVSAVYIFFSPLPSASSSGALQYKRL